MGRKTSVGRSADPAAVIHLAGAHHEASYDPAVRRRRQRSLRTQAERSSTMQARLRKATLESLTKLGYTGTSLASVATLAGVSRGAVQHHFEGKAALVAAALGSLTAHLEREAFSRASSEPPGLRRVAKVLDGFWRAAQVPPLPVAAEVRVAARTDAELRAIIQPGEYAARLRQRAFIAEAVGEDFASLPDLAARVDSVLATVRGLSSQLFYQAWNRDETEAAWGVAREDFLAGLERARAGHPGARRKPTRPKRIARAQSRRRS